MQAPQPETPHLPAQAPHSDASRARQSGRFSRACAPVALAALLAAACGEDAKNGGPEQAEPAPISIGDANNYQATSSLSIPVVRTAPATDLDICWADVETDIQCHELSPSGDVDNVGLLRIIHLDEAEVESKLATDTLEQSAIDGYVQYPTSEGDTCTKLSSFSFFDTMIDLEEQYVESNDRSYLLIFTTGTVPGMGARSMIFIEPTADSDNTRVDAEPGCGILDFSADLASAEPLVVPEKGPWPLDWHELGRNGLGNPVPYAAVDRALVAFYAGRSVEDLEAGIFDLETTATELYEIPLEGGRTTDLALATERTTGEAFSGFARDDAGVWLFALLCGTCQNPSPVLLTVLEPSAEGF